MSNTLAILVLACASSPYDRTIHAIRMSWGSLNVPGLDIYYVYGNPGDDYARHVLSIQVGGRVPTVGDDGICQIEDVLIAGCADHRKHQTDCLLRKRLIAFDFLAGSRSYDRIYTVCATSYVDQPRLSEHASSFTRERFISGAVSLARDRSAPFVSGASMLLSGDLARELGRERGRIIEQNRFGFSDDVAIGHWVASHLSRVPLEAFVADIEARRPLTDEHLFVSRPGTTVNFVNAPPERQRPRPEAFHYHFHSRRPKEMIQFHRRHYAAGSDDAQTG